MSHGPSPARWAALNAMLQMGKPQRCLEEPTDSFEIRNRMQDAREQALAERLVKGVLRHKLLIDALVQRFARQAGVSFDPLKTPAANLCVLRLAVFEKIFQAGAPDYAIGAQAVALARKVGREPAARFINALIRKLFPLLPADIMALKADPWFKDLPLSDQLSIPADIMLQYEAAYGDIATEILRALSDQEAATWVRVNTLKGNLADMRENLAAEKIECEPAPGGLPGLRWIGGPPPWKSAAWGRGQLAVQDLAAQLAAVLLAPQPGETVTDLCASPGGKTGHLWETMGGTGRLTAWEIDPRRRSLLRENLERLYGHGQGVCLSEAPDSAALITELGPESCSAVLVDAPCQALGLIRRHPEIRWDDRLWGQSAMQKIQRDLLVAAARLVKRGGRLLWVTCSPTLAENEEVIGAFLRKNPEWRTQELIIPPDLQDSAVRREPTIRTRPDRLVWDAFAYTMLIKRS